MTSSRSNRVNMRPALGILDWKFALTIEMCILDSCPILSTFAPERVLHRRPMKHGNPGKPNGGFAGTCSTCRTCHWKFQTFTSLGATMFTISPGLACLDRNMFQQGGILNTDLRPERKCLRNVPSWARFCMKVLKKEPLHQRGTCLAFTLLEA